MQYAAKLDPVGTDVLVIGDGAGLAASSAAGEAGARAILVERDEGMNARSFPRFLLCPVDNRGKGPGAPGGSKLWAKTQFPRSHIDSSGVTGVQRRRYAPGVQPLISRNALVK